MPSGPDALQRMEPDRLFLILSTLCFLAGFGYAAYALGARRFRDRWLNRSVMALGFVFQSAFLYVRGQEAGRCPITSVFEILVFVSWAIVLLYFLVGPAYRLSLLGVFTAPVVFLFQLAALLLPAASSEPGVPAGRVDFWLEIHASVSLLAYGAFALACVAGVMFLVQDRLLKTHHLNALFYSLPPVNHLARAMVRLLVLGFALLTVGIAAAYGMEQSPAGIKLGMSYAVWLLYGTLIAIYFTRGVSSSQMAKAAVGVFILPVCTLWIVSS